MGNKFGSGGFRVGESNHRRSYVSTQGTYDPSLKESKIILLPIKLVSDSAFNDDYLFENVSFNYFLNEKGLFEESPRGLDKICLKSKYDAKTDLFTPVEILLPGRKNWISAKDLLSKQVEGCQTRFNDGNRLENIGFVNYPTILSNPILYLDYIERVKNIPSKGTIKEKVENLKKSRLTFISRFSPSIGYKDKDRL